MNHVLGAMDVTVPPQNAKQLLATLARIWADKPGGRTRQIQIQSTAALLHWAVADRRLGEDWEPPQDLAVFVGRCVPPRRSRHPWRLSTFLPYS